MGGEGGGGWGGCTIAVRRVSHPLRESVELVKVFGSDSRLPLDMGKCGILIISVAGGHPFGTDGGLVGACLGPVPGMSLPQSTLLTFWVA